MTTPVATTNTNTPNWAPPSPDMLMVDYAASGQIIADSLSEQGKQYLESIGKTVMPEVEVIEEPIEPTQTPEIHRPRPETKKPPVHQPKRHVSASASTDQASKQVDAAHKTPEIIDPNMPTAVEGAPAYMDRYNVYDKDGNILYDISDPDPKKHKKLRADNLNVSKQASAVGLYDYKGKPIVIGEKKHRNPLRWASDTYVINRRLHYGIQAQTSGLNNMKQKSLSEGVGSGPDDEERIAFTKYMNGRWVKYDGSELSPRQVRLRKVMVRRLRDDIPLLQACIGYEIGKREEAEIPGAWQDILDLMYQEMGLSMNQINETVVGIQYAKKTSYLTVKHSRVVNPKIKQYDKEGKLTGEIEDKTRIVFGPIDTRSFATELGDKFRAGDKQFSVHDVAEMLRLTKEAQARMEAVLRNPAARKRREFINDAYFVSRMRIGIETSRMRGQGADPSNPDQFAEYIAQQQIVELAGSNTGAAARGNASNEPSLYGVSDVANKLWREIAPVTDRLGILFPAINKIHPDDFTPLQRQ